MRQCENPECGEAAAGAKGRWCTRECWHADPRRAAAKNRKSNAKRNDVRGRRCRGCGVPDSVARWSLNVAHCASCHRGRCRYGLCQACGRPNGGKGGCTRCDEPPPRHVRVRVFTILDDGEELERTVWRLPGSRVEGTVVAHNDASVIVEPARWRGVHVAVNHVHTSERRIAALAAAAPDYPPEPPLTRGPGVVILDALGWPWLLMRDGSAVTWRDGVEHRGDRVPGKATSMTVEEFCHRTGCLGPEVDAAIQAGIYDHAS